jgi:hypothetical protein
MIELYALTSPNMQKIFIMLEECELPYNTKVVDVRDAVKRALARVATIKSMRDSATDDAKDRFFGRGKYAQA